MIAKAEPFVFLTSEGLVKIPYFQRMYVWGVDEWDKLFDDMCASYTMGGPYLGTIIMQVYRNKKERTRYALVVDGQQRLTTLSLLLKALYDSFDEEGKENCIRKTQFFGCLFHSGGMESTSTPRIEHSMVDSKYYQEIINLDYIPQESSKDAVKSRIVACYYYMKSRVMGLKPEERVELLDNLTSSDNEMLVVIRLDEADNEQRIFDTMNTAGARLSSADTIKNYLFQRAMEADPDNLTKEEVIALYKEHWEDVFAYDDDAIKFWSTVVPKKGNYLELLLRSIAEITDILPLRDNVSELIPLYKKKIDSMDVAEVIEHIELVGDYGRSCRDNVPLLDGEAPHWYNYSSYKKRLFSLLSWNYTFAFTPYILCLLNEHRDDKDALADAFKKFETMFIRQRVCGYKSDKNRALCHKLIHNPTQRDSIIESETPTDKAFRSALYALSPKVKEHGRILRSLLFWLELYRRETNVHYKEYKGKLLQWDKDRYTLEHIMPIGWRDKWRTVPVIKGGELSSDYYRDQCVNYIGNLTLIPKDQNVEMGSNDFRDKIEGGSRRGKDGQPYIFGGLKDKSLKPLGLTMVDIVAPYTSGKVTTWNETHIVKRTRRMIADIMEMWPWLFATAAPAEDTNSCELVEAITDAVTDEITYAEPEAEDSQLAEHDINEDDGQYPEDTEDLMLIDGANEPDDNVLYEEYTYFQDTGKDLAPEDEYQHDYPVTHSEEYYSELFKQTYDELAEDSVENIHEPVAAIPTPEAPNLATLVLSDDPFARIYDVVAQAEKGFQDAYAELEKTQEERAAAIAKSREDMQTTREAKIREMHNDEDTIL